MGGEAVLLNSAEDDIKAIAAAVATCACDVVVTIGGASVGVYVVRTFGTGGVRI